MMSLNTSPLANSSLRNGYSALAGQNSTVINNNSVTHSTLAAMQFSNPDDPLAKDHAPSVYERLTSFFGGHLSRFTDRLFGAPSMGGPDRGFTIGDEDADRSPFAVPASEGASLLKTAENHALPRVRRSNATSAVKAGEAKGHNSTETPTNSTETPKNSTETPKNSTETPKNSTKTIAEGIPSASLASHLFASSMVAAAVVAGAIIGIASGCVCLLRRKQSPPLTVEGGIQLQPITTVSTPLLVPAHAQILEATEPEAAEPEAGILEAGTPKTRTLEGQPIGDITPVSDTYSAEQEGVVIVTPLTASPAEQPSAAPEQQPETHLVAASSEATPQNQPPQATLTTMPGHLRGGASPAMFAAAGFGNLNQSAPYNDPITQGYGGGHYGHSGLEDLLSR